MKAVIGLGNVGQAYERTRHNAGFLVADELARRAEAVFRRGIWSQAAMARVRLGGQEVLLVKPVTLMNCSGTAVAQVLRKKGLAPADLIVMVDDTELDIGRLRIRERGGTGGHNGLRSIVEHIGSGDFVRVRIGIGRPPAGMDMTEHVLGRLTADEWRALEPAVSAAADAVTTIIEQGIGPAMNRYNNSRSNNA